MTEDLDDTFGRAFGAVLRDQPPRTADTDLVGPTLRTARAVRRRRRRLTAGGAILASVVAVVSLSLFGLGATDRTVQPATPSVAVPGPSPSSRYSPKPIAARVDLRLDRLKPGSADGAEWADGKVWHRANGTTLGVGSIITDTDSAQFYRFGDGLFASQYNLGNGPHRLPQQFVIKPDLPLQRLELASQDFVAGPGDTVLWLQTKGFSISLHQRSPDGSEHSYPLPDGEPGPVAATRDAVFVQNSDGVTRYTLGPAGLTDPHLIRGVELVVGNPNGDRVVLANDDGCTAVVTAADPEPQSWQCRYSVRALSADGRYAYGFDYGNQRGALFDADGNILVVFDHAGSDEAVFTADDRLVALVTTPAKANEVDFTTAVVSCTLEGDCLRVSEPVKGQTNSGQRPLALIKP